VAHSCIAQARNPFCSCESAATNDLTCNADRETNASGAFLFSSAGPARTCKGTPPESGFPFSPPVRLFVAGAAIPRPDAPLGPGRKSVQTEIGWRLASPASRRGLGSGKIHTPHPILAASNSNCGRVRPSSRCRRNHEGILAVHEHCPGENCLSPVPKENHARARLHRLPMGRHCFFSPDRR